MWSVGQVCDEMRIAWQPSVIRAVIQGSWRVLGWGVRGSSDSGWGPGSFLDQLLQSEGFAE
jgi:hypothetical protein